MNDSVPDSLRAPLVLLLVVLFWDQLPETLQHELGALEECACSWSGRVVVFLSAEEALASDQVN